MNGGKSSCRGATGAARDVGLWGQFRIALGAFQLAVERAGGRKR
jgi:hypothetical protein